MSVRGMAGIGGYSFDGISIKSGEQIGGKIIESTVSFLAGEDGATEKIVSYGILGAAGVYFLGSMIRVLL